MIRQLLLQQLQQLIHSKAGSRCKGKVLAGHDNLGVRGILWEEWDIFVVQQEDCITEDLQDWDHFYHHACQPWISGSLEGHKMQGSITRNWQIRVGWHRGHGFWLPEPGLEVSFEEATRRKFE
jgi:hypothetical protein